MKETSACVERLSLPGRVVKADVVKQNRNLEVIDQDLRVLRRAAADNDARVAERNLQIHDARHHGQGAHDIATGSRHALQLLAIELGRTRCRRGCLAAHFDRLGGLRARQQDDIVERGLAHLGEANLVALCLDHEVRADRCLDAKPALLIRRDLRRRALDRDPRTTHGPAEGVDDATSNGDRLYRLLWLFGSRRRLCRRNFCNRQHDQSDNRTHSLPRTAITMPLTDHGSCAC
jgi:hypothetical protein